MAEPSRHSDPPRFRGAPPESPLPSTENPHESSGTSEDFDRCGTGRDLIDRRLKRIEWLIGALVAIALLQTALLCVIAIGDFLPSLFKVGVFVAAVIAFVVVFRKQIPGWFAKFSRFVFSHLDA